MTVYNGIASIQVIASYYLGFLPDLLGFELFVGALGLLVLLLKDGLLLELLLGLELLL